MRRKYPYLYETHLHTSESSACAHASGYEMAKACHEAGFAGIIVTDHNWGGNTCTDRTLPWTEFIKEFCKGYLSAKAYADEHPDFDVFFGYEAGFHGTEFLIYGISPQWLIAHPQIRAASLEDHLLMVRQAGGLVVHAHPFREEPYIPCVRLFPELVDAVEGINASHSHPMLAPAGRAVFDRKAMEYAASHHLPMTAGSDVHRLQLFGGGVAFAHRLKSIDDFCAAIRNNEDRLLTNGHDWFDKDGNKL